MQSLRLFLPILLLPSLAFAQYDLPEQATAKENAKQWHEAEALWTQVVNSNPTVADYWFQLGVCKFEQTKYLEAIPDFQKADDLGVAYRWAMPYRIARCYARAGDKEDALKWIKRAIDLGYRYLSFIAGNDDFKDLRSEPRFQRLTATEDLSQLDRNAGWRYDLHLYASELMRRLYDPYRKVSKKEFDGFVAALNREIPRLTDNQVAARMHVLAAKMGDGHTNLRIPTTKCLPINFYFFREGPYIISAAPGYADLVGAKVLRFENLSPDAAFKIVEPLIPRDNAMTLLDRAPKFLRCLPITNGIGMTSTDKEMSITIQDAGGVERTVRVPGMDTANESDWVHARNLSANPLPLTFSHREKNYWFQYLSDQKLVYFQYNEVADQEPEAMGQFCGRMFKFIDDNDVQALVIDLRWNGGGNNFLNKPLIGGLIRCTKLNKPGKIFTVIGRSTFSAAMCCAAQIESATPSIFVGEPTGSSPNFVGEAPSVDLPFSKLSGAISDLYWQNSVAMDYRIWIPPTLYAPPSWELYKQNRDPALEAIQEYRKRHS